MQGSPQELLLTTSTATHITTAKRTYKRSVRRATTEKPALNQASDLMKKYNVKRNKAGVLLFPCTITLDQAAEIMAALKR